MTVFVDDMYLYPIGQYGRMKMSHMVAYREEDLHAMADAIGVSRRWYQGDHYDIAKSKRDLAIQYGAVPISYRNLALMMAFKRFGLPLPPFNRAEEWFKLYL